MFLSLLISDNGCIIDSFNLCARTNKCSTLFVATLDWPDHSKYLVCSHGWMSHIIAAVSATLYHVDDELAAAVQRRAPNAHVPFFASSASATAGARSTTSDGRIGRGYTYIRGVKLCVIAAVSRNLSSSRPRTNVFGSFLDGHIYIHTRYIHFHLTRKANKRP